MVSRPTLIKIIIIVLSFSIIITVGVLVTRYMLENNLAPEESEANTSTRINYTREASECVLSEVRLNLKGTDDPYSLRKPLDVVLVLDRSGSMDDLGGEPLQPITDVKTASKALVDQLDPSQDRVGIVSYADTSSIDLSLSSDFAAAKTTIDAITPRGDTSTASGLQKGTTALGDAPRPDAVKVMVLLTDGVANRALNTSRCTDTPVTENQCLTDVKTTATNAKDDEVIIYTIGLNLNNIAKGNTQQQTVIQLIRTTLETIATSTETFFEAPDQTSLSGIFQKISSEIISVAAYDVMVNETLPEGYVYVDDSAVPAPLSVSENRIVWNLGIIPLSETRELKYQMRKDSSLSAPGQSSLVSSIEHQDHQNNLVRIITDQTSMNSILCIQEAESPTTFFTPVPSFTLPSQESLVSPTPEATSGTPTVSSSPTVTPTPTNFFAQTTVTSTPTVSPSPSPTAQASEELLTPTITPTTTSTLTETLTPTPVPTTETFTITGLVWDDNNQNGTREPGEGAISDVIIELLDESGTVIRTATTTSTGQYTLTTTANTNLKLALSSVNFDPGKPLYGYNLSPVNSTIEEQDNDFDPVSKTTIENFAVDDSIENIDAGVFTAAPLNSPEGPTPIPLPALPHTGMFDEYEKFLTAFSFIIVGAILVRIRQNAKRFDNN